MNNMLTPLSSLPTSWGVDGFYPFISIACLLAVFLLFNGLIYFLFKTQTSLLKRPNRQEKTGLLSEALWTTFPLIIFVMIIAWGYTNIQTSNGLKQKSLTVMSAPKTSENKSRF